MDVVVLLVALRGLHGAALQDDPQGLHVEVLPASALEHVALEFGLGFLPGAAVFDFLDEASQGFLVEVHRPSSLLLMASEIVARSFRIVPSKQVLQT